MEAKDTVMSDREQALISQEYPGYWTIEYARAIAKAQAEISFKAGQEEERRFILQNTDRDKRARLEGKREVVTAIKSAITEIEDGSPGHAHLILTESIRDLEV